MVPAGRTGNALEVAFVSVRAYPTNFQSTKPCSGHDRLMVRHFYEFDGMVKVQR
jgi:hypothetical protein